ncbi:PIG-L family deacetylase [Pengzhenrongella phosphoraccumulans]|uniref:PIG-L family deacetylase n=1 Tax=Pengzhenrongella phosphoraccumulans TaxID=3114394 RepID=UPI00388E7D67
MHRETAGGRSPSGGLLAVHAHPDDETLATGGLLATWADAGRPVTVVTCTRGELGEVIGTALAHLEGDGPALAAHRERELAGALAALGVTDHVFLDAVPDGVFLDAVPDGVVLDAVPDGVAPDAVPDGDLPGPPARFSDSGMAWAGIGRAGRVADLPDGAFVAVPLDAAARRLARVIRERRPDVVVTYEPGGGYGHPDHVRAHDVTIRALELARDAELDLGGPAHVPGAVLVAVVPADALRAAYRALPELPAVAALRARDPQFTLPDPDGPLPSVAVAATEVDVVVDVAPVLHRLAAALAAHATQVRSIALDADRVAHAVAAGRLGDRTGAVVGCYALSNDVLLPVLSTESYRRVPGAGAGSTPEHLTWPDAVHPVA